MLRDSLGLTVLQSELYYPRNPLGMGRDEVGTAGWRLLPCSQPGRRSPLSPHHCLRVMALGTLATEGPTQATCVSELRTVGIAL